MKKRIVTYLEKPIGGLGGTVRLVLALAVFAVAVTCCVTSLGARDNDSRTLDARAALQVADYAYVLETGQIAMQGPAHELADDPRVIEAYLGLGGKHQAMLST